MDGSVANIQNREQPAAPKIDWWSGWQGSRSIFDCEWWFTVGKRLFKVTWHQDSHPRQSWIRLHMMVSGEGWSFVTALPAHEYGLSWDDLQNHTKEKDIALDAMWTDVVPAAKLAAKAMAVA